ncbi:MAG: hypothetical protein M3N16_03865 [Actinomycetota bacterium]|nr:hypothetical protein [Actinomycetota bacterium]
MRRGRAFLRALETALHGSGLPYGYAVTVWSTGGMLTGAHGVPSVAKVFLFALGAAAAYGTLTFLTRTVEGEAGTQFTRSPRLVRAGAIHLAAIGLAVGSAALIAQIDSPVVWLLAPFSATALYLGVSSIEKALLEAEGDG